MTTLGLGEQLERALQLGTDFLGLELGIVSRIRGDDYEVHACVAPPGTALEPGQHFSRSRTYCDLIFAKGELVAIDHMAASGHRGHPCYEQFGLEAYIGVIVEVQGERYGTLNFSSVQPRPVGFSDGERMFVRLLARWIGSAIERDAAARALRLSETRLRGLFELSPVGIALNDYATGAFVDLNQALLHPTGYTREEFIALSYWDVTRGSTSQWSASNWSAWRRPVVTARSKRNTSARMAAAIRWSSTGWWSTTTPGAN